MAFTLPPPQPPRPLPANQPLVDPATGLPTKAARDYELRLAAWREALTAYLAQLAAAIP